MLRSSLLLGLALLAPLQDKTPPPPAAPQATGGAPAFTSGGRLKRPAHYREWIYLTSGLDMSYNPGAGKPSHSIFDNVFVNPDSWARFQRTGTWPDGTTLLIENRTAESSTSINRRGQTQSVAVLGLEVHVKDASIPGGWGFYSFDSDAPASLIPRSADCYACHQAHAAVDTTFVQFYPTLLPIARQKNTLSREYLHELATPAPSTSAP